MDAPDFELIRIRTSLMELLKSFFSREPDGELIATWRGALPVLSSGGSSPSGLSAIAQRLISILESKDLQGLQDEYYELFVDPFGKHHVITNVCYYLDGRNFGESFVRLKEILTDGKLAKAHEAHGSEDELVVVLDAYQQFIEGERNRGALRHARMLERQLLSEILVPFSHLFEDVLLANPYAEFYAQCACLMRQVFEMEKILFI